MGRIRHVCPMIVASFAMQLAVSVAAAQDSAGTIASERPSLRATPRAVHAQALLRRPVSVRIERLPLEEAIRTIASKAGVTLVYQGNDVAKYSAPVTVRAT